MTRRGIFLSNMTGHFQVDEKNKKVCFWAGSVTRLLDHVSTFGHLHQWKFAQKYAKFAIVGSKFCQIVNKPSKKCPNLITLLGQWRPRQQKWPSWCLWQTFFRLWSHPPPTHITISQPLSSVNIIPKVFYFLSIAVTCCFYIAQFTLSLPWNL